MPRQRCSTGSCLLWYGELDGLADPVGEPEHALEERGAPPAILVHQPGRDVLLPAAHVVAGGLVLPPREYPP